MKISVVIPTHNRADALALTLAGLAKQQLNEPWEVIVVNNRCSDGTVDLVEHQDFPVPLRLVSEDTPGAAAARNAGAAQARGRYLVFIDNDILVEPDFLRLHLDTLENNSGAWIVGQIVNLPEQETTPFGRFRKSLFPLISPNEGLRETDSITTANLSLPKTNFEELGGFDESFFVASGEDRELMLRARKKGIRMLFHPGIIGTHNDWAGFTIREYCLRQRTYTQTEPMFWRKHPEDYPRLQLVVENSPPRWKSDTVSMIVWKRTKQILGTRVGQAALISACGVVERLWPSPSLLSPLYRLAIAGAIYKGFQEGLAITESAQPLEGRNGVPLRGSPKNSY